jgi:hypothetical protein
VGGGWVVLVVGLICASLPSFLFLLLPSPFPPLTCIQLCEVYKPPNPVCIGLIGPFCSTPGLTASFDDGQMDMMMKIIVTATYNSFLRVLNAQI